MKMINQTGIILMGSVALVVASTMAWAQSDEYEPTVSTGIHIRSDGSGGSVLAQAARMGASVVIGSDDDGEYEDEGSQFALDQKSRTYTVQDGDTLWGICSRYFGDPYVWPQIWSYNTKITNPNWIYPGDVIGLSPRVDTPVLLAPDGSDNMIVLPSVEVSDAILLRNRGFVDKKFLDKSGEIVGAHKATMLLAQFDEAYVEFPDAKNVRPGDEFAMFRVLQAIDAIDDPDTEIGNLVEILGLVRVTRFDKENGIARVIIDEAIRPIERGTMVGPIHRRFDLVPSVTNSKDMEGHMIAMLDPVILSASHQVVFVDRGLEDGVRDGNRFFAIEHRDNWHRSLDKDDAREGYPLEVVAEMRVIEARPHTSTCLITSSVREIEVGHVVQMRKGY
jgi:LysM domain